MSLQAYFQNISTSIRHEEGSRLGCLLSLRDPHIGDLVDTDNAARFIQKSIRPPWDELVETHIRCVQHAANGNYLRAFEEQQAFIQVRLRI